MGSRFARWEKLVNRLRLVDWLVGGLWAGKLLPLLVGLLAIMLALIERLPFVYVLIAGLLGFSTILMIVTQVTRLREVYWLTPYPFRTKTNWQRRLYVGRISAGIAQFTEDHCVEIGVIAFNGSDSAIRGSSLEGYISLRVADEMQNSVVLPPPAFSVSSVRHSIPAQTEFLVVLEQRIPIGSVSDLAASLAGDRGTTFDLRNLSVMLEQVAAGDKGAIRLPLWQAIRVRQFGSFVCTNAETYAELNVAIGAASNVALNQAPRKP